MQKEKSAHARNHERLEVVLKIDFYLLISSILFITVSSNPPLSTKFYFIIPESMDQQHSTLELARYDETARAPERDHDATALELDLSALAPQVSRTPYVITTYTNQQIRLYLT